MADRKKKLISLDFDGVLHGYQSGWQGAHVCADAPVPGALDFLRRLVEDDRYNAVVYSSRCGEDAGRAAIAQWLERHLVAEFGEHVGQFVFNRIRVATSKPPAFVHIDDRAWTFDGSWPDLDAIDSFTPWNKRPAGEDKAGTTCPMCAKHDDDDEGAEGVWSDAQIEAAVAYAVESGAGWTTAGERTAAELGARRVVEYLTRSEEEYEQEVVGYLIGMVKDLIADHDPVADAVIPLPRFALGTKSAPGGLDLYWIEEFDSDVLAKAVSLETLEGLYPELAREYDEVGKPCHDDLDGLKDGLDVLVELTPDVPDDATGVKPAEIARIVAVFAISSEADAA